MLMLNAMIILIILFICTAFLVLHLTLLNKLNLKFMEDNEIPVEEVCFESRKIFEE